MSEGYGTRDPLPKRILVVTPFDDGWRWLSDYFPEQDFSWHFHRGDLLQSRRHKLLIHAFKALRHVKECDLVVSHGPWMTLFLAFAMRVTGQKKEHIAFTFNHGNGRFFSGLFLIIARRLLSDIQLFVTYSQFERHLLSGKYRIPINKMAFTHWAVRKPRRSSLMLNYLDENELCISCIGRNNRDIKTFLAAVGELPVTAILICRPGQTGAAKIPQNVIVRYDVSKEECDKVMDCSKVSVIPLLDDSTGAGHMTIVSAMLRGLPQVITRVTTVEDYFRHGDHGLFIKKGSVEDMRKAIMRLLEDSSFHKKCSVNSKAFADEWLCEEAAARYLERVLDSFFKGKKYPLMPPNWTAPNKRSALGL